MQMEGVRPSTACLTSAINACMHGEGRGDKHADMQLPVAPTVASDLPLHALLQYWQQLAML